MALCEGSARNKQARHARFTCSSSATPTAAPAAGQPTILLCVSCFAPEGSSLAADPACPLEPGNAALCKATSFCHLIGTIAWEAALAGDLRYWPLPVIQQPHCQSKASLNNIVLP